MNAPEYVCAECGQPIVGEDPHTDGLGEDVHAACCPICQADGAA